MFLFSTSILIVFTIFVFGLSMRKMITGLKIQLEVEESISFKIIEKHLDLILNAI